MRLLLDEMHAIVAAQSLREGGIDAVAVAERTELRGRPDEEVLAVGSKEQRVVVTENVRDFAPLASSWAADGHLHAGIIYTHPRRFARATAAYPGSLITALRAFVDHPPTDGHSWAWWLD